MHARMAFPDSVMNDTATGVQHLYKAMYRSGAPQEVLELVHLRASQVNGCSACVNAGVESAQKAGETDERLHQLAAWYEAPQFTEAERAALELTEVATRLADGGRVPDAVYDAAAAHYSEEQLAGIILMIAATNFFNRLNASIRVPAGTRWN
ncbi:MAG TPA: carboxymuconolactone decarboxylase family protein [Jatrophihabitantaceae bacterium]|nr:carboxymuconolactone decarboxylase family protein [Jatrophihabitantaceae bacterium]